MALFLDKRWVGYVSTDLRSNGIVLIGTLIRLLLVLAVVIHDQMPISLFISISLTSYNYL